MGRREVCSLAAGGDDFVRPGEGIMIRRESRLLARVVFSGYDKAGRIQAMSDVLQVEERGRSFG